MIGWIIREEVKRDRRKNILGTDLWCGLRVSVALVLLKDGLIIAVPIVCVFHSFIHFGLASLSVSYSNTNLNSHQNPPIPYWEHLIITKNIYQINLIITKNIYQIILLIFIYIIFLLKKTFFFLVYINVGLPYGPFLD